MFIPKELLQAIVLATIIGISIVIGFAIYSPKTSFDACIDEYIEMEQRRKSHIGMGGNDKTRDYTKEELKERRNNPEKFRTSAFLFCRKSFKG